MSHTPAQQAALSDLHELEALLASRLSQIRRRGHRPTAHIYEAFAQIQELLAAGLRVIDRAPRESVVVAPLHLKAELDLTLDRHLLEVL